MIGTQSLGIVVDVRAFQKHQMFLLTFHEILNNVLEQFITRVSVWESDYDDRLKTGSSDYHCLIDIRL